MSTDDPGKSNYIKPSKFPGRTDKYDLTISPTPQPSQAMPSQPDELDKILNAITGKAATEAFMAIDPSLNLKSEVVTEGKRYLAEIKQRAKAAIRAYTARKVLEGRIEEAGSVQLTYGHMMAQTHAGGKWQSMIERRDDLKAQLAKEQP